MNLCKYLGRLAISYFTGKSALQYAMHIQQYVKQFVKQFVKFSNDENKRKKLHKIITALSIYYDIY